MCLFCLVPASKEVQSQNGKITGTRYAKGHFWILVWQLRSLQLRFNEEDILHAPISGPCKMEGQLTFSDWCGNCAFCTLANITPPSHVRSHCRVLQAGKGMSGSHCDPAIMRLCCYRTWGAERLKKLQVVSQCSQCQEFFPLHWSKYVKVAWAALLHAKERLQSSLFCMVLKRPSNTYTLSLYLGLAESGASMVFLDGAKGCDAAMQKGNLGSPNWSYSSPPAAVASNWLRSSFCTARSDPTQRVRQDLSGHFIKHPLQFFHKATQIQTIVELLCWSQKWLHPATESQT